MLSQNLIDHLNHQINLEIYSSHLYLQMSSWCVQKSLDGCALFLNQHANEEMMHMRRLLGYLHETGAYAVVGGVEAPPTAFSSLTEVFEKIYAHEQLITKKISHLVHIANTEPDYATLQFLQWYVAEQHQEEFLFKSVLDKIKLIGTDGQGLFFIDEEIRKLATNKAAKETTMAAEEAQ
ncbi:non-heme ferritin [Spirulina major CS-329]|uniref:non-heme ferritin n=1 Tax=Spirulina TaxID=1154 RepID=UPI002330E2E0|nr:MULTISPECIES: non-heme ferritin [Spirulina]MDB9494631.1 non-heme ferritin [Spirulina subsalsa CS-330]MDB9502731.1 non-heme ferritin [Spirulina major CS-329]